MSVIVEEEAGRVVTVRVSGKLTPKEWAGAQKVVSELMRKAPAVALLVVAENFQGWAGSQWEDMSFQLNHDHQIERMAIVAEPEWEDQVLMFAGQGLRKFAIKYFAPAQLSGARVWVAGGGGA
jgi:hypothetical protein